MPVEALPKPEEETQEKVKEEPKSDEMIEVTEEKEVIFNNEEEARAYLTDFIKAQHDAEQQYFQERYKEKELVYKEEKPGFWGFTRKIENTTIWAKNQMIKLGNWFEDQTHLRERFGEDEHGKLKSGIIKTLIGGGSAALLYLSGVGLDRFTGAAAGISLKTAFKGILEIQQSLGKEYREMKRDIVKAKKELEYKGVEEESLEALTKRIKSMHEASKKLLVQRQKEMEMEKELSEKAEKYSTYGALGFFLLFGAPMGVKKFGGFEAVKKIGKHAGKELAIQLSLPSGHSTTFNGIIGYLREKGIASFLYNAGEADMARNFADMTGYKLSQSKDFLGQFKHILKPSKEVLWSIGETALSYAIGVFGHHKVSSKLRERHAEKFADGVKSYQEKMKEVQLPEAKIPAGTKVGMAAPVEPKEAGIGMAEPVQPVEGGAVMVEPTGEIPAKEEVAAPAPEAGGAAVELSNEAKKIKSQYESGFSVIKWKEGVKGEVSKQLNVSEDSLEDFMVDKESGDKIIIRRAHTRFPGRLKHEVTWEDMARWVDKLEKPEDKTAQGPEPEKEEPKKTTEAKAETATETDVENSKGEYKVGDAVEFKRKNKEGK